MSIQREQVLFRRAHCKKKNKTNPQTWTPQFTFSFSESNCQTLPHVSRSEAKPGLSGFASSTLCYVVSQQFSLQRCGMVGKLKGLLKNFFYQKAPELNSWCLIDTGLMLLYFVIFPFWFNLDLPFSVLVLFCFVWVCFFVLGSVCFVCLAGWLVWFVLFVYFFFFLT